MQQQQQCADANACSENTTTALKTDQVEPAPSLRRWEERGGDQGTDEWKAAREELDISASDAAKCIGASNYATSFQQLLYRLGVDKRTEPDPKVTGAGHANEDLIAQAVLSSQQLFFDDEHQLGFYVPWSCVLRQPQNERFYGASPDRVLVSRKTAQDPWRIVEPVSCLEIKFHLGRMPLEPSVEHLIQCFIQMRILGARQNFLCTATRAFFCESSGRFLRLANAYERPLEGRLCVRVYRVEWSDDVWRWIYARLLLFHQLVGKGAAFALRNQAHIQEGLLPHVADLLQLRWCNKDYAPYTDKMEFARRLSAAAQQAHPILQMALETNNRQLMDAYVPPRIQWSLEMPGGDYDPRLYVTF